MGYLYNIADPHSQGSGISGLKKKAESMLESALVKNYKEIDDFWIQQGSCNMKPQFCVNIHKACASLNQMKS